MDHLLHTFHYGQVYFMILTVRFTRSLCYCYTPSTHIFLLRQILSPLFLKENSLSSLFPFFICSYSLPSTFLLNHRLHFSFIFFINLFIIFMREKKTQKIKKMKLHNKKNFTVKYISIKTLSISSKHTLNLLIL